MKELRNASIIHCIVRALFNKTMRLQYNNVSNRLPDQILTGMSKQVRLVTLINQH